MKIKKKLKDITEKEYLRWRDENCQHFLMYKNCTFGMLQGYNNRKEKSCLNHKELFSNEFLNQETEIEIDILDKVEKEYLRNVIKPFKNNIRYIIKQTGQDHSDYEYITIFINSITNTDWLDQEYIVFPYFKKGTMYKNMEIGKKYTLEELGLFLEEG